MAIFNKFFSFTDDLVKGVFDFSSDTFMVCLTNTAPVATNHLFGDIKEIKAQNGYVVGGAVSTISDRNASGVQTISTAEVPFMASSGSFGPFRYVVLYDATPMLKPLVGWYDYGSSATLNAGESFTVPGGNLFTLA